MKRPGTITLSQTRSHVNIYKLVLCFIAVLASTSVMSAYDLKINGICYNLDSYGGDEWRATVTSGGAYKGKIVIPEYITYEGEKYEVTCIGERAFENCSAITEVIIPNTVTRIDKSAFKGCIGLTEMVIPESVGDNIYDMAFYGCKNLLRITLPGKFKVFMPRVFYGCTKLTQINIPQGVTQFRSESFCGCNITSVTIPKSVHVIEDNVFKDCANLMSIKVEDGSEYFDSRDNCNAIIRKSNNELVTGCGTTIIPNSVLSIGEFSFSGNNSLKNITIPESVTEIGYSAFSGCNSLKEVIISGAITKIEGSVFIGCSKLEKVVIPESVTEIDYYAFANCSNLRDVVIPEFVTEIGNSAFAGCSNLGEVTIPKSVEKIEGKAFYGSGVTKLNVSGRPKIGNEAFRKCNNLDSLILRGSLGEYTFAECAGLTHATVFSNVKKGTFYDCVNLSSVTFNNNSSYTIEESAFENCSLKNITLNVYSIKARAFRGNNLISIRMLNTYPPEVELNSLGYAVFNGYFYDYAGYDGILYVPSAASKIKYSNAQEWNRFKNIVVYDTSGIEDVGSDDGMTADEPVEVFNMAGVKVADSTEGLPSGIYIVRQGAKTTKLAIR